MKRKIDMTLNGETAQRFRETARRLVIANLGADGLLAANVLSHIAESYERAANDASPSVSVEDLNAESDEWVNR